MTVTYSAKAATATFSCFFKLLIRWHGSIYKILWREFVVFAVAYFSLSFIYRFLLSTTYKRYFEMTARYCAEFGGLIPVAFVLGFYVNYVASRWWEKFQTIPWPGSCAMLVSVNLHGLDERARLMRRTVMRYICLSFVMTMASISPPVKKRFPTWQHMVEAGFMLSNEQEILENIKTPYNKYFVPLIWSAAVINRARKEGRIKDDFAVKTLIDEINGFRSCLFKLFNFDWVTIPLVYTQVVTLAVYTFFLSCLMGRQFLETGSGGDMYFPFFTFLQFLFYMGWLKVAETMLNPFGEDDDDFDINHIIDRNLKISYLIVDEMHEEHPELIKDQYWDTNHFELPYTTASEQFKTDPHIGSAADIEIPEEEQQFVTQLPKSVSALSIFNNDVMDVNDENAMFIAGSNMSRSASTRRSTRMATHRPSVDSHVSIASKASSRFGGFLKSVRKASRRNSSDAESLQGLQHRYQKKQNVVGRSIRNKSLQPAVDWSHRPDVQEEIFEMSDTELDQKDLGRSDSTAGLVPEFTVGSSVLSRTGSSYRDRFRGQLPMLAESPADSNHNIQPLQPQNTNFSQQHQQPDKASKNSDLTCHQPCASGSYGHLGPMHHHRNHNHRRPSADDVIDVVTSLGPLDTINEDPNNSNLPADDVATEMQCGSETGPSADVSLNVPTLPLTTSIARDLEMIRTGTSTN